MPAKAKAPRSAPPREVGGYAIFHEIGRGAFGVVFDGLQASTGTRCALKSFPLAKLGPEGVADLRAEVALLQKLHHRNIVKYMDSLATEDMFYIVLELVEDGSLAGAIKRLGPLRDEAVVAAYVAQVLRGLAYLHAQRVVHRDIKGANILVTRDGCVKLADFGVAKTVHPDGQGTLSADVVGTPYWMAPEVIQMEGSAAPCDVWSVGAT